MTTNTQSTPSVSSGGSPETYHGASSGYHPKNTYRQISGQVQNSSNILQYAAGFPGGQYPPQIAYYPQIPGSNGFPVPTTMFNGPPMDQSLNHYYHGPTNSWPIPGPIPGPMHHVYPSYVTPLPHAYGSPPRTPPQPQMAYGYPMLPSGQSAPPNSLTHATHEISTGHNLPPLDHRRNSWSSSGATDTPTTPFPTNFDITPAIMGETQHLRPEEPIGKVNKSIEALVLSGNPIPRPIPGVFSPGASKTLSQTLENPTNTTNVYIRGLPPNTDDGKLFEMTSRFGSVISHKAIMDTEHGTCKGYGFARYETVEEAEKCIRGLVSLKYEAGFARESFNARLKTLADPNSTNVYVSNLPKDMNEKAMQDIFAEYIVVSNRILRDANGNSRGVGFARFESREICNEIIRKFHGTPVGDERLPLQVRYADTSAQKRLKATTTKKRQFRANEYNNVVNNNYNIPFHVTHQPHIYSRNRMWLRQNSIAPNADMTIPLNPKVSLKNWEKSQDWIAGNNDENSKQPDYKTLPGSWRHANGSTIGSDSLIKLETVHEKDDTVELESQSNRTTTPNTLDYGILASGKASSGSYSDPGDSYGGREYSESNILIL